MAIRIDYECGLDYRLNSQAIFTITDLIITEENPTLRNQLTDKLEAFFVTLADLGNSWDEIRDYFNNHLLDCKNCRALYIDLYQILSCKRDAEAQGFLLNCVKEELNHWLN